MNKYILWGLITLLIIGCSSKKVDPRDHVEEKHEIKTVEVEVEVESIASLAYKKDFTKIEQKQCAFINAELALSEKFGKTVNERMKESRKNNHLEYQINLPCVSRENLNLKKNIALLTGENNSSYKARTWKISGSDTLYIWAGKLPESITKKVQKGKK